MELKDIIRNKREELNLTYEELGNMLGVGKSTVRKWETGMIENMRRDNIVALSKALKISPAIIMGWEDVEPKQITLTQEETSLLTTYNKLNTTGKTEAVKRVAELTYIDAYTTDNKKELTFFSDVKEATAYLLKQPSMAAFGGFNPSTMSDEDIIDSANEILLQFEITPHKYKNKKG